MQGLRQLAVSKHLLSAYTRSAVAGPSAGLAEIVHDLQVSTLHKTSPSPVSFAAVLARSFATDSQRVGETSDSRVDSNAGTSTSQPGHGGDGDYLEDWAKLIEKNDIMGQADLLNRIFGEDPEPVGPPLSELLNYNRREEERAKRRLFEMQKQEEIRQSRVQVLDKLGRSYGTGKRKTSIARVWLQSGTGEIVINGKSLIDYFGLMERRSDVLAPLAVTNTLGAFNVRATVKGGGNTGQAQALRHGISKALQLYNPNLRSPLKAEGFITRDSRIVERKKPGKAKARKSFQWVKR